MRRDDIKEVRMGLLSNDFDSFRFVLQIIGRKEEQVPLNFSCSTLLLNLVVFCLVTRTNFVGFLVPVKPVRVGAIGCGFRFNLVHGGVGTILHLHKPQQPYIINPFKRTIRTNR
eukprot:Lithocolla_globosa_v1_NODE_2450_length_2001_cov_11.805755.p2 type:complete len:114 gc:universal NODE_2450_length_2001_cov_11.805755:200-541(+)